MKEQSASGILGTSIEKIKDLVDVSTIIGDPIKISETLQIIPVSKVTYGFASGGTDFPSKSNAELFGGGGQRDAAFGAGEQRKAALGLHARYRVADGGRRDVQPLRRGGKGTQLCYNA